MEVRERTERKDLLKASGRITPREVLAAYRETNYSPMVGDWFQSCGDGRYQACALTVVAATSEDVRFGDANTGMLCALAHMQKRFPYVHEYYRSGFTRGFDGNGCPEPTGDNDHPLERGCEGWERLGWRDGKRAASFVFGD